VGKTKSGQRAVKIKVAVDENFIYKRKRRKRIAVPDRDVSVFANIN